MDILFCSEKSDGTVRTDSLSTSIKEEVDALSVISSSGGGGARFYSSVSYLQTQCLMPGIAIELNKGDRNVPPLLFASGPSHEELLLVHTTSWICLC